MAKFKAKNGVILETKNEFLVEQYKKKYTEIKETKGKKKDEATE